MELSQALQNIRNFGKTLAKDEMLCIREHKDEAIPSLLEILANDIQASKTAGEENEDLGCVEYAMYLLAEFGAHEMFPLLIEILELDEDACYWIIGDILTDGMSSLIGSVAKPSDIDRIKSVVENTGLNMFHRTAAVSALTVLYTRGLYSRGDLVAYFGYLLDTCTEDEDFTGLLVSECCDIAAIETYARIRELYKTNSKLRSFVSPKDFAENAPVPSEEKILADLQKQSHYCAITDSIESMESWSCFNEDEYEPGKLREKSAMRESLAEFMEGYGQQADNVPIVKPPKIGRNEPCPCGSGQKYKRCCLGNI